MIATQTAYFTKTDSMNKWLKENAITVKDIKVIVMQYSVAYLVIYEREFKEKVVYE